MLQIDLDAGSVFKAPESLNKPSGGTGGTGGTGGAGCVVGEAETPVRGTDGGGRSYVCSVDSGSIGSIGSISATNPKNEAREVEPGGARGSVPGARGSVPGARGSVPGVAPPGGLASTLHAREKASQGSPAAPTPGPRNRPASRPTGRADLAHLAHVPLAELEALVADGIGCRSTDPADLALLKAATHAQLPLLPCRLNLLVCALEGGAPPEGRGAAYAARLAIGDQQTVGGSLDAFRLHLVGVEMHALPGAHHPTTAEAHR